MSIPAAAIRAALAPPLEGSGFSRLGSSRVWSRQSAELTHVVAFELRQGTLRTQWGVISAEVAHDLWPRLPTEALADPAYAVMTGWLDRLPGSVSPLYVDPQDEQALEALSVDLSNAATWLGQFRHRRDLASYLLAVRDEKDPRGFLVPANLPLKLTCCAFLLAGDNARVAQELAAEALGRMTAKATRDAVVKHRLERLNALAGVASGPR